MDDIQKQLNYAKDIMEKAYEHTQTTFSKIRAGKAMPNMLDGIMVSYYGTPTALSQVASINTPDARTIFIKPWDKKVIGEIEKAILSNPDLGLTPQNDGEMVVLNIPPLTEERRIQLVKQVKVGAEKGRVVVRNIRKEVKENFKRIEKSGISEDEIKRAEEKLQKYTDDYTKRIDDLCIQKEKDIMVV